MTRFDGLQSLEQLDLDQIDPTSLSEEESDVLMQLVGKELEELEQLSELLSCPICRSPLEETKSGPVCMTCVRKELGKRSLTNSLTRVDGMLAVLTRRMQLGLKPKSAKISLYKLVPRCLFGVDFKKAYNSIDDHTSPHSTAQRKFIIKFAQVWDLYDAVVEKASLVEEALTQDGEQSNTDVDTTQPIVKGESCSKD